MCSYIIGCDGIALCRKAPATVKGAGGSRMGRGAGEAAKIA
jgi:hypothetical protein